MFLRLRKIGNVNVKAVNRDKPRFQRGWLSSSLFLQLQQVPAISVEVFEDSDSAVGFFAWSGGEFYSAFLYRLVVPPEVVGMQEEKDASTGLVPDSGSLFRRSSARQQKRCAVRMRRCYQNPAFPVLELSIFNQYKPKNTGEVGQGFVIIANYESDIADFLRHRWSEMLCIYEYSQRLASRRAIVKNAMPTMIRTSTCCQR